MAGRIKLDSRKRREQRLFILSATIFQSVNQRRPFPAN